MLDFPLRQQVGPIGEAAHDAIDVGFRDRLESNPAKLIFQKPDLGARFNPVPAAEFCRDHQLAFGGECCNQVFDGLDRITSKLR